MGSRKPARKKVVEQCAARVMETVPLVMRFIRADMRVRGSYEEISVPQFRSLAFLDKNPGASLSELADHLGVTRATASANTERLVQRNFVDRCDHPEERRRVVLKLTPAGKEHLEATRAQTRLYIGDLLTSLSDDDITQVEAGLSLLKQVFEQSADST
ncbi:MarR family winged helix-turn-helix transcriptional regulator [Trichocoleus sp. FACHB-262]|uniref:MarR family winged helix-turn-helix transcriptional regulator n=1 Tax=Trichocoleus sp. FACHB-262 TaxID=2692869 RepID=UPI001684F825|nr:MarR family transcriptional regulator [Trichocoleus sp. FACHB-262]MBD2123537.1 MarR family transcriptional regulator [Trichocoleus sp. FACHB-262]